MDRRPAAKEPESSCRPIDPDRARLEQRAEALCRDLPHSEGRLDTAVRAAFEADSGAAPTPGACSIDQARLVLAREHGEPDWSSLGDRLQSLVEGRHREPMWSAAQAIRAADQPRLDALLAEDPELIHARGTHGLRLLHLAVDAATHDRAIPPRSSAPHERLVDRLLEAGARVDAAADHGWTALHSVAFAGHAGLARRLLEAGADRGRECWDTPGATPLSYALFYAHGEAAAVLAEPGAVPHNLRNAAALGDQDALRSFFREDGTLRSEAHDGREFYRPLFLFPVWSPSRARQECLDEALSWAARAGRVESMEELLRRGARVDSNAYRGTPLLWAIYAGRIEAARWLIEQGADPDQRHDFGGSQHGRKATALHLAAQFDDVASVRLLLDAGADPTIVDGLHGGTPREWAEFSGAHAAVKMLKDAP